MVITTEQNIKGFIIMTEEFFQRSVEQDAVRILFILKFCGDPLPPQLPLSSDDRDYYICRIDSETKLQKLDFWVRYPDYLCLALLQACSQGYSKVVNCKGIVKSAIHLILENEEPRLRLIPMLKYLRGAYEPLDTVMSFLYSRGLVEAIFHKVNTCYDLTRRGDQAVDGLQKECPETRWYGERCKLINDFFGYLSGCEIRALQYEEQEYKGTMLSELIAPVPLHKIAFRFEQIFGEPL